MRVYRITARAYRDAPLSGMGAALTGGRWNSRGTRMGYAAQYRSLALLEMLVHVQRTSVPGDRVMVAIEVPDEAIQTATDLPAGWDRLPYAPAVQAAGDAWARSRASLALRVPSAIVKDEWNLLVNPLHERMPEIRVEACETLVLDDRLFPRA